MINTMILLLLFSSAAERKLQVRTADGIDVFHYNSTRVSEADMKRWAQLSENVSTDNFYLVPERPQVCLDAVPEYNKCGSRDLDDPNFYNNAKVNLSRIKRRIALMDDPLLFPAPVKPVVEYFKKLQTTFLVLDAASLQYLQDGNISDLSLTVDGVAYGQVCKNVLGELQKTTDRIATYRLVTHEWNNCVNAHLRSHIGAYPEEAWKSFLEQYAIREKFTPTEADK